MLGIPWSVRPATADDAVVLTDIVVAAMKEQQRWPSADAGYEAQWRGKFTLWTEQCVRNGSLRDHLSVIEVDGQPAGRLRVLRHPSTSSNRGWIELAGIQLLPAVQNQGIGSAIVRDLQSEARDARIALRIGVEKDNPRARALYERLGCVVAGETDDEHVLQWDSRPTSPDEP